MDEMKYAKLTEVIGRWKADMVESFLKAEGVDVVLFQDALSHSTYINPFATVQVFVPKEMLQQARELLKDFEDVLQNEDEDEEDNED